MDGIIIINKPKGYTSHDVVSIVKKTLNIKKVGHTGTLDPNATGVLPILIGMATKVSKYLVEHDKEYIAEIFLGEKRDTADIEGAVIDKDEDVYAKLKKLSNDDIKEILKSFVGEQKQIPPRYSAIKIKGKKAYEYARQGKTIEILPRNITIYNIEFFSLKDNILTFKVLCSKGTYIRTLCEDIANKMNTVGYMLNLIRTKLDKFSLEDALELQDIEKCSDKIISVEDIFKEKERIILDDKSIKLFLNGVQLKFEFENGVYRIYNNRVFVGLGIINNSLLKRDVVFI